MNEQVSECDWNFNAFLSISQLMSSVCKTATSMSLASPIQHKQAFSWGVFIVGITKNLLP